MKTRKVIFFPTHLLLFGVEGGQGAPPSSSGCKAGTHPGQDTRPPRSRSLRPGPRRHASSPDVHTSGGGGQVESRVKTHADVGRTRELHTDGGPGWELIFFFFSSTL